MNVKFPLDDVILREVDAPRKVKDPLFINNYWQINQYEFAMQVEGIGEFYACNGKEVDYSPEKNATMASVELYLNGSVYGAILHQRKILPFHGSSFIWRDKGIMLCGDSGAGKSSLTAGFCFTGADFLTDDVTPFLFEDDIPSIIPLSDRIKLWDNALLQLNQQNITLDAVSPGQDKYYYPISTGLNSAYPVNKIYILVLSEEESFAFQKLEGPQLFTVLRNEVYRWEYLSAMPETEKCYIKQLLAIASQVEVFQVKRPKDIPICEMLDALRIHIEETISISDEVAQKIF